MSGSHGSLIPLLLAGAAVAGCGAEAIGISQVGDTPLPSAVTVRVVADGESTIRADKVRRMIVGPSKNQPEPFLGYRGFVGWESPLRLSDGTMLVAFSAGYWHVSLATPLQLPPAQLTAWQGIGFPTHIEAPSGGRAMLVRSIDQGRTWSKPTVLLDSPWDDRHPSLIQLRDGTVLCMLFTYPGVGDYAQHPELAYHTAIIRSTDGGRSWEQELHRLPSPFFAEASDGPPLELADGSVLLAAYGPPKTGGPDQIGVFRSTDSGRSWELLSTVQSSHALSESSLVQLPSGRLVLLARSEGDIAFSDDLGRTFTTPRTFGMRMYEPGFVLLRDGTLLALHGSFSSGGLRVIMSPDGGETWLAPSDSEGFTVDSGVYGYAKGIELPDGSVYIVYIDTAGHHADDAMNEAIWSVRLRVREDHKGIVLLPPYE